MRAAVMLVVAIVFPLACNANPPATSDAAGDKVIAILGERPITDAELERYLGSKLIRLRQQEYDAKVDGLRSFAFDELQKAEAARLGISQAELYKQNVTDKAAAPDEAEITQTLARFRSRLPQDDEQARQKVVEFLTQRATQTREQEWRDELLAKTNLKVFLTAPRMEIAVDADDPVIGPADAPVTIVEISDFQCPYCQRAQATLNQIKAAYGGKVRLVFKQLPLAMHPNARLAAEAALCAHDQGRYEQSRDWLFANAGSLTTERLKSWAAAGQFDAAAFAKCLDEHTHAKAIDADIAYAASLDANSTPTFFVNGRLISGARPFEDFKKIIDEELAQVAR